MDKKNIVVLGGGFGGLRTAIDLSKKVNHKEWSVILIDRNSYQTFTPSLYEVASAFGVTPDAYSVKLRKTIVVPFDEVRNADKINFVQAEIDRVDLENRKVITRGGQLFDFEYCVIALGAETDNFGIPGVSEYAYMMKTIDDGVAINQKLNSLFKEVASTRQNFDSQNLGGRVKIVVGGGGFNGVETATELACCAKNLAKLCGLNQDCRKITIIEAMPKILPMIGDKEREKIYNRLKELNISVMEGDPIIEVAPQNIILKSGEQVEFDMLIWSSGVKANSFLKNIKGLELDEKGRIIVDSSLQVNVPGVFAIGDNISFADPKTEKPIPGMAYLAIEQGRVAAENISRQIKNKKLADYKPEYDYWIAPVGGKNAIANISGRIFTGFVGWLIRELVDLKYLMGVLPASRAVKAFSESTEVFIKND